VPRLNEPVSSGPAAKPAGTAPRPSTKPNQKDPSLTAGEVQGRGEYPGIPGYSTMDNWTRSQATGTYTAPDYVVQLLEKAGYTAPVIKGSGRQSIGGLNFDAAEDLTPYGYSVSDEEARNILESYAPDAKGDPAKITAERVETKDKAVPMTVAAYNALSDDQRAAVDFNTALIAAREKDLASGWKMRVAPEGSTQAEARKTAFGEDAVTGGYPEHTMKLLERIGYKAPGSSLEDFMSLDMAISADELANLKLPKDFSFATPDPNAKAVTSDPVLNMFTGEQERGPFDQVVVNDYGRVRSSENMGMLQLDVIRKASEYLKNNRIVDRTPATTASVSFGAPLGPGNDVPWAWSMTGKDVDPIHNEIFEVMLNDPTKTKVAKSDSFWAQIRGLGYKEKDIDKLFAYLDERTRWMAANGETLKPGQNDASVIREMAGLGPADG
jgi:hypothetical protein